MAGEDTNSSSSLLLGDTNWDVKFRLAAWGDLLVVKE